MPTKGHRPPQAWLVTLTYDTRGTLGRGRHNWNPKDLARAVDAYRRWCIRNGYECKYTWVCELQGNGTPHYHLVAWLPQGVRMPMWDRPSGKRDSFWGHGMTETDKLKTNVGYLMKYLSKMGELTVFPKGLRLNGNGGLDASARAIRAWHNLPSWVRAQYGVGECLRLRGGLVDASTGEVLEPAYRAKLVPGGLVVKPVRELPPPWWDGYLGAYCSWSPKNA